jgi:protein-tyrosine phosphatase
MIMKTKVVKIDAAKPDKAKLKEAATLIDAGALVAFPTETVYGIACRVGSDSLKKLNNLKNRPPDKHYTLHISQKANLPKYVPSIGIRAEKLIKNAWPGPLTIVFNLEPEDIKKLKKSLEKDVFKNLYNQNSIGIRCPDNPVASQLLQMVHNPVVAPSANITGQNPAVKPEQVLAQFSGQIEMLLDAGPCKYKKSSTVVKINKNNLQIIRPGEYSQEQLQEMAKIQFLFLCTGNTCRSPMAEGIFRKYLAEKLNCEVDHLEKNGYKVCSAGTMGLVGMPATMEAVTACAAKGFDIKAHRNRAMSQKLIEDADIIYAMSRTHCRTVRAFSEQAADKCLLLAKDREILDPIGQSQRVYNKCADLIEKAVKKRISELKI